MKARIAMLTADDLAQKRRQSEVDLPGERRNADQSDVLSIWGLGADDVWVTTTGFGGPTIHWDGMAWSYRSVGEQGSATAVWGRGPDDVYVTLDQTVVMAHWTGDPIWEELKYPGAQPMYGVVGTDTELWIGGRNMMLHHDGNAWSEVQEFESTQLYSLDRAEDDILAVGARGVIGRMHDGAWNLEAGGLGPLGTTYGSVWGYAADDVWVGGWPLGHWDGESLSFPDLGLDTFQRIGARSRRHLGDRQPRAPAPLGRRRVEDRPRGLERRLPAGRVGVRPE